MPENKILNTPDGTLRYWYWNLPEKPRACLVICHGLGEHIERYKHVAAFMNEHGIEVLAADLRGHGKSHGQRGHIKHLDDFASDLSAAIEQMQKERPGVPLFLLGHSLGGLVSSYTVLKRQPALRGLIMSAAALQIDVPPVLLVISRILNVVWPNLPFPNGLSTAGLSRDANVVKAYEEDPMVHDKITPRAACQMMDQAKGVLAGAPTWKQDTLVIIPGSDKLVPPQGSRDFFAALPAGMGEVKEYPDTYHEPFNDLNKEEVLADVLAYIEKRI